jgi:hypothetical protein
MDVFLLLNILGNPHGGSTTTEVIVVGTRVIVLSSARS